MIPEETWQARYQSSQASLADTRKSLEEEGQRAEEWHRKLLAEKSLRKSGYDNIVSMMKAERSDYSCHSKKLIREKEAALRRGRARLRRIRNLEERLRKTGQVFSVYYAADLNSELKPKDPECYSGHCESIAKRLREEESVLKNTLVGVEDERDDLLKWRGQLADQASNLKAQVNNLKAANKALNKALIQVNEDLRGAKSHLGNEIEARRSWEWEASKANSRAGIFKMSNENYETKLVQMIKDGDKREKQLAEMIKEGEARVEAFDRWEAELEAPSESKTEKSKLAKEKRRLLISMSGYSADVLKTFVKWGTPVFIVAIIAIAVVKIYG